MAFYTSKDFRGYNISNLMDDATTYANENNYEIVTVNIIEADDYKVVVVFK